MTTPKPIKLKPCPFCGCKVISKGIYSYTCQNCNLSKLQQRVKTLELVLLCWSCKFSKYLSWNANKVPAKEWPDSVVADYKALDELTQRTLKEMAK